jgi:hypothetical protein
MATVCDTFLPTDPTLLAIDRSGGQLEFSVEYTGDDDLLQYLCERWYLHFYFLYFSLNSGFAEEQRTFILSFLCFWIYLWLQKTPPFFISFLYLAPGEQFLHHFLQLKP